jgi:DNA-binding LacI/PurR family transcriptional regulator
MTNIRDIARLAGVSKSTVSRVINNEGYVSEEKKEAVQQAIKISNYQKNMNAVRLSIGKNYLIGVVIPFSDHPYFTQLIKGISNEALTKNYHLILIQSDYKESREMEALDMLKHKLIDALIICSRVCDWSIIEEYEQYGSIVLCEDTRGKKNPSTFIDHYKSFITALEYLYEKGHKKIGYCIGRRSGQNSLRRELAYKDFMKNISEPFRPDYIFERCLYFEDGARMVKQIRQMDDPPTALLVTSDQVAAGILTCGHNENITIPDNLAIIGFDNQPIAEILNITTIEMPLVEIGKKLFLQAVNEEAVSHEEIAVQLIERKTV